MKHRNNQREIQIWRDTQKYIARHPSLQRKVYDGTNAFCIRYFFNSIPPPISSGSRAGIIRIENTDTLTMACAMKGERVGILNMASDRKPGGGVQGGSKAQEENIARRSNLVEMLDETFYPLSSSTMLLSPNVTIFKNASYQPCEHVSVAVISVAALRNPKLNDHGRYFKTQKETMTAKIRGMIHLAIHANLSSIVLGAFGCGAFHNPPEEVASIFAQCLINEKLRYFFDEVGFAILVGRPDEQINLLSFQEAF